MASVIHYVRARNFAILDCECIQTSSHQCVRSLYILCKDDFSSISEEFYACKRYRELTTRYKKAFRYCQKHVHHLRYEPRKTNSLLCAQAMCVLQNFVRMNRIDIVLFKVEILNKDSAMKRVYLFFYLYKKFYNIHNNKNYNI